MAKLERKTQKIFCSNADNDQITAFGTAKTASPLYTTDIDAIQTTTFLQGWTPSLMSDLAPYLQDSNGLWYTITRQLAYVYQEGIPEYDVNTEYSNTSIVKQISGNDVKLFRSKQNGNIGRTLDDKNYWEEATFAGSNPIGQPIIKLDNTLLENEIRLEGATVSRTTYASLFAIYGTTYGTGDGSTTFTLPDFRNRAVWGASDFGYLTAGLPNINGQILNLPGSMSGYGANGAFWVSNERGNQNNRGDWKSNTYDINFSASHQNNIYGASSTVQPPSIKVRVVTRYK